MPSNSLSIGVRLLMAALSGWLLALAYPTPGQWWCAPISVAIFSALAWNQTKKLGAITGFVYGWVAFLVQHTWLTVVGVDATWILSFYLAIWIGAIGIVISIISRAITRKAIPWPIGVLAISSVWVLEEFLRGRYPFGGYPWARLAFSQADSPLALWSRIGGIPWLSFVVVAISVACVAIFISASTRAKVTLVLLIVVCFLTQITLSNASK